MHFCYYQNFRIFLRIGLLLIYILEFRAIRSKDAFLNWRLSVSDLRTRFRLFIKPLKLSSFVLAKIFFSRTPKYGNLRSLSGVLLEKSPNFDIFCGISNQNTLTSETYPKLKVFEPNNIFPDEYRLLGILILTSILWLLA